MSTNIAILYTCLLVNSDVLITVWRLQKLRFVTHVPMSSTIIIFPNEMYFNSRII